MNLFCFFLILACVCVHTGHAAIGTSDINCNQESSLFLGSTTEGFEGDIEILTNISPSDELLLESYMFPISLTFLELVKVPEEMKATIRTTKPLDADALSESGGTLSYAVTCKRSTLLKNTRTLQVQDINDNAPVFEQKLYTANVSETAGVDSRVLKGIAHDADVTPQNNIVTYSILPPAPDEFQVWNDGIVRLRRRLNYNIASVYKFTIIAMDVGNLNDTTTVIINVQDFDNMNPYFDHTLYQAFIAENQDGPITTVMPDPIKAQDGDTGINEAVEYIIISVTPNKYQPNFHMDQDTGIISVNVGLDREETQSITLHIQAAQKDDKTKTTNAQVLLTIEDVDDNEPEFNQSNYTAVIQENSPRDYFVLQAKVTDRDQGGFLGTLRIVPDTTPFSISPDGCIRVKKSAELDRETTQSFVFQIEARENAPSNHSATASVNITLSDENDNSPVFGSSKYEGKVPLDQVVGMPVVKIAATDLDEGPNGQIRYFIDFGNDEGYFGINENTGMISLNKTIQCPKNEILRFFLYVSAKDGGSVSRSASALVDIKMPGDALPQFLQKSYQGKVEEEQEAGTEIVKITFLSLSPAVPVTLTVETEADKFSIDQLTGMLRTKVKLDHEVQKNYTLQVSISDGTNRDEASVHIDVLDINDNRPKFATSLITIQIPENSETEASVTQKQATDADSGLNAEIRYSLEGSAGMFRIDPVTGVITVGAVLDRETQDKYNLTVVAQDQGRPPLSATASVTVILTDVNDNAPVFSIQCYEASVFENATVGTNVILISATDKDDSANARVTYNITKQEPPSSPSLFSIHEFSGVISVTHDLVHSQAKKYSLEVDARDGGSPTQSNNITVVVLVDVVNDKAPMFSKDQYDVAVYENIKPGSPLVSLEVTDENEGGFSNGHFLLTSDVFHINPEGVVHLLSNSSLDRETKDNYVFKVVAVDKPVNGLSATALINITVLDVNDNNPQYSEFQNPVRIPEDQTGKVTQIQVSDQDIGPNGEVNLTTYAYNDVFGFQKDGTLMVTGTLDREKQEVYDLVLVASDYGTPSRQNVTTLTVIVTDINDNAPVFSQPSYSTSVLAKEVKKGALVLKVSATDQDTGNNSIITYRFSKDSDLVDLKPETGDITWTRDLTNITEDLDINLMVIAVDHGTPRLNATATVRIELRTTEPTQDIVFQNSTYSFSVKENEPKETYVGEVKALTGSPPIQVMYSLTSHTDLFMVDKTGVLKTLKSLDKEEKEVYIVNVEATDSGTPPSIAKTTMYVWGAKANPSGPITQKSYCSINANNIKQVVIQVEDLNEPPVFEHQTYKAELFSVTPFRYPVITVKALDPDVWDNDELRYSLQESGALLGMEPMSGQVYVVDLTGVGGQTVTTRVTAIDTHGLSATAEIQIYVKASSSENIVEITLNQPVHTVQLKISHTQKSLEKVLGWSVHIISVRGEHGNVMRSRETKTDVKTYISFIATDTDGHTVSAQKVHEKLKSESESVNVELENVFGSGVKLEGLGRVPEEQENQTTVIVLGVMFALSLIAIIALVVVVVIRFRKIKDDDSDKESFSIGKSDSCSGFTKETAFNLKQEDQKSCCSNRKSSEASQKGTAAVTSSDDMCAFSAL